MATLSLEDRKRKSRNILFSSFILLIVIWTVKLSFPQSTLLPNYTSQSPSESTIPTSKPLPSEPESDGRWKSRLGDKPGDKLILTSDVPFNGTISNKAAVIIESRYRTNIIPLIIHFNSVLGPSWPILIYTSPESIGGFSSSAALQRYIQDGVIQIRLLPQTVLFTNSESINEFMMSMWFWESLAPAEHIFIFQSDSMICANAARSVEDYFEYDFVGALLSRKGYNGGLSLRKRSSILRVLENFDWEEMKIAEAEAAKKKEEEAAKKEEEFKKKVEVARKKGFKAPAEPPKEMEMVKEELFEDQWYYDRLNELRKDEEQAGIEPEEEGAINLPTVEIARTFSVETIDYPHPLGVHQVHRWLREQIVQLDKWCPEYKLCSEDHMNDAKEPINWG